MIPLTRQDVLAHQAVVPWPSPRQIEQDLLLSRAIVALFNDPFLRGQIAMRGGTVLHKVHLAPASRYSEDIDLVVVEANVSERKPHRPVVDMPFGLTFRNAPQQTVVRSFDIHEMLGAKMRALFQRYRGRDLFDRHWALRESGGLRVDPVEVANSFLYYMRLERTPVRRRTLLKELDLRLADAGFCSDMEVLLRTGLTYDPQEAGRQVRETLVMRLPE